MSLRHKNQDRLTDARVKAILGRSPTPYALAVLRREAGAPPLNPRQPKDNPYRLAPLMADEITAGREAPMDGPMASRETAAEPDARVKAIEKYCRASAWVTLASFGIILLAILLAVLVNLEVWP